MNVKNIHFIAVNKAFSPKILRFFSTRKNSMTKHLISHFYLDSITVKQYIKGATISTVKDIFNYVVNHKFPELSRSDVMDINTIISQLH